MGEAYKDLATGGAEGPKRPTEDEDEYPEDPNRDIRTMHRERYGSRGTESYLGVSPLAVARAAREHRSPENPQYN